MAAIYEIDSDRFSTLEGFFGEVSRVLIPEATWGHNLDAFNDILRGGFGTPEDGFTIRWKNHALSRDASDIQKRCVNLRSGCSTAIQETALTWLDNLTRHALGMDQRSLTGLWRSFAITVQAGSKSRIALSSNWNEPQNIGLETDLRTRSRGSRAVPAQP